MKEYIRSLILNNPNPIHARNIIREYLQARILGSLQRSGAMIPLAFQGGTALRFLYNIPRFSEDLDFSLENPSENFLFRRYLQNIQGELRAEGYNIDIKVNDQKTVNSAFIRLYGLFYEMGLSNLSNEALSIKIEVDTNPPSGASLQTTLIRRHVTLRLQHYDRASLLAGKIHAILQRPYLKGRDLYDLIWYLSDPTWELPNFVLLANALMQTGWQGATPTPENWKKILYQQLQAINFKKAQADIAPFLENPDEIHWITVENISLLLNK